MEEFSESRSIADSVCKVEPDLAEVFNDGHDPDGPPRDNHGSDASHSEHHPLNDVLHESGTLVLRVHAQGASAVDFACRAVLPADRAVARISLLAMGVAKEA